MGPTSSTFYNPAMAAMNVATFAIDPAVVDEFAALDPHGPDFETIRPGWDSDVAWHSPCTPSAFDRFEEAFGRLGIAKHAACHLDLAHEVRMYAGFLITRSRCERPDFHVDWKGASGQAFTVLAPVAGDFADFGLVYRNLTVRHDWLEGAVAGIEHYHYRRGEAIMIGEGFVHSTEPRGPGAQVMLLSFACGTDKQEYWEPIRRTVGRQARLVRRPDGRLARVGPYDG